MRNGLVKEAQHVFDQMPHTNTVTWNTMIRGYFQNGQFKQALSMFDEMPYCDIFSYNTTICGLMQFGEADKAKQIFNQMPHRDIVTWNSMISGYFRNGLVDEALWFFDRTPSKNVVSWNLVIMGLVNYGKLDLAEQFFKEMGIRDIASWTTMVSGLASAGQMVQARELFDEMPDKDIKAWNTIMAGYIENGYVEIAEVLFQKMPEWNLDSFNKLINGLVKNRRVNDALRVFHDMPEKCRRSWNSIFMGLLGNKLVRESHAFLEKHPFNDIVSQTNLVIGYFEVGEVNTAVKLFELIPNKDSTLWNATIFGLGENDQGEEGLKLFIKMKEVGPDVDESTFTSVLMISSYLPTLNLGKQIHSEATKKGFNSFVSVSNAMITMYSRCGSMDSALLGFCLMRIRDTVSWNSIICGFAHQGNGEKAFEMFEEMILTDNKPNQITFIGVLSACSHAGLVEKGKYYFNLMRTKFSLQPSMEHYTCFVDLLGKSGLINEAMGLLGEIRKDGVEVPASVYGALLGACRIHKNIEAGEIAGLRVLDMEPYNAGVYMILAEMYLNSGNREDAEKIWVRMKENGVKKQPGCSWIEVNNIGYVFLAGDSSHPEFDRIYRVVELMHVEMVKYSMCKSVYNLFSIT